MTEVTVVEPKAEQVEEGLADLERCLQVWKEAPALLVIKPELGLIVSVLGAEHDRMGFAVSLAVQEKLVAPPEFDERQMKVHCVWNQPYMSFDELGINAPYSFSLHLGAKGIERARDAMKMTAGRQIEFPDESEMILGMLKGCFTPELFERFEQKMKERNRA